MAPTLTASYYVESPAQPSGVGDTNTLVTPSFTPADGEVIVVKTTTWDTATASGTPSGGSLTYTSRITEAPGGFNSYARIFTAVVGTSPGSMTVTLSAPAASSYHSMCVERWSGAQLAGTPATDASTGTGAPAPTITTTGTNSVVSWVIADINSADPATRAYRSSATQTGLGDGHVNTASVYYHAYQSAASSGSQTYGLTAPTGQQWVSAAIEVQDSGAGGTTPNPRPPVVKSVTLPPRQLVAGWICQVNSVRSARAADAAAWPNPERPITVITTPPARQRLAGGTTVPVRVPVPQVAQQGGVCALGLSSDGGYETPSVLPTARVVLAGGPLARLRLAGGTTLPLRTAQPPTTPATAELGTGALGLAATSAQSKTVVEVGNAGTGLATAGTGSKVVACAGSAGFGAAGTGTARRVAPQAGAGALGGAATAAGKKVTAQAGPAAAGLAGAGTAAKKKAQLGVAAAALAATESGFVIRPVNGATGVGLAARGAGTKTAAALGQAALGAAGRSIPSKTVTGGGAGALGAAARGGAATKKVNTVGQADVGLSGSGAAKKAVTGRGTVAWGLSADGDTVFVLTFRPRPGGITDRAARHTAGAVADHAERDLVGAITDRATRYHAGTPV